MIGLATQVVSQLTALGMFPVSTEGLRPTKIPGSNNPNRLIGAAAALADNVVQAEKMQPQVDDQPPTGAQEESRPRRQINSSFTQKVGQMGLEGGLTRRFRLEDANTALPILDIPIVTALETVRDEGNSLVEMRITAPRAVEVIGNLRWRNEGGQRQAPQSVAEEPNFYLHCTPLF